MPEPGIADRNFTRPTTGALRRSGERRQRNLLKIPREYADFQLEDGRRAIDVLGEKFFEPTSGNKWIGEEQSGKLGNKSPDLSPGLYRDDAPSRPSWPPSRRPIGGGDNDAGFANLPFGPEEEGAADEGAGFPIAKPRPERTGAEYAAEPPISEWSPAGKDPYAPRGIPTTGDGRVNVRELEKGVTYEVEDGTRFAWDGENFRELYRDRNTGAWLIRTDPAGRRVAGHPGAAATPHELMDAAEDIQRETGRFRTESDRIRVLATDLARAQRSIRNFRLNGLPDSDARLRAALDRLANGMPKLRGMYDDLVKAARPEVHSVERMAGRMDDPGLLENAANSAVQGGVDVFSSVPIFFAVSHANRNKQMNDDWNRIDEGLHPKDLGYPRYGSSTLRDMAYMYHGQDEDGKLRMRGQHAYADPRASNLYRFGMGMREYARREFEINPRLADAFFVTKLPRAIGSAAAAGLTTVSLQAVGVPQLVAQSAIGLMTESSGLFLEALENNEPIEYAYKQFGAGHLLGMAHGLPVARALDRVTGAKGEEIRKILIEALGEGTKEAALNAVRQSLNAAQEAKVIDREEMAAMFATEASLSFAISLLVPQR